MAEDSNTKVPHKRRREQKTDYQQRRKLLKSGKPRAVVRLATSILEHIWPTSTLKEMKTQHRQ